MHLSKMMTESCIRGPGCFYPPRSDSIPHDSLCPWTQLEQFHLTPGKKIKHTKTTEAICLVDTKLCYSYVKINKRWEH